MDELAQTQELERLKKQKTETQQTKKADQWIGVDDWNFH
jgi:hypothetical protein